MRHTQLMHVWTVGSGRSVVVATSRWKNKNVSSGENVLRAVTKAYGLDYERWFKETQSLRPDTPLWRHCGCVDAGNTSARTIKAKLTALKRNQLSATICDE